MTETVHLINWREPDQNDLVIAEEVTLAGNHDRRPDLVLYVNGIAIGVVELKNSRVTLGDAVRQCGARVYRQCVSLRRLSMSGERKCYQN